MNHVNRVPRGRSLAARTAGQGKESARGGFPHAVYQSNPRGARPRELRALPPQGPRRAGVIERRGGELVLIKTATFERHCLRFPELSWAFDREVLRRAKDLGVVRVEVRDETGRVWRTSLAHLLECGVEFDRGHGRQLRLPLRLWSFQPADTPARQVSLFEASA